MKKLLLVSLCFLLYSMQVLAQNRTITGTVTAKEDGGPIPGVGVKVKGTTQGTATGGDGKYSINVPESGGIIVFSFIGYTNVEIPVGKSNTINAVLTIDSKQLGEVVVTALGITRESKSLGYAVSVVKGDEITKARETNVVEALAGKVAGVRVTSSSGTLGGGSKIVIRGATSIGSDVQPIFVVDGLIMDNSAQQLATSNSAVPQGSASVDFGNRAADINSDDIESINVLKGAAAAALYGTLAKNGAIVITTKRGKKGQASITIKSSTRFDNVLVLPDFQNEYAQGNQGVYNLSNTNGWGPKISDVQGRTFPNFLGQNVQLQAYPDNVKNFFQTGKTYFNSADLSGGDDNGDYRFGYTNIIQSGIVPGQSLNKNAVAFNSGRKLLKGLDIRTSMNYVRTNNVGLPTQSSNDPNVLSSQIFGLPRTVDIGLLKDNYVDALGQQVTLTPSRTGNNPFWLINNNTFSILNNHFYGNAILTYKIAPWLTLSDNIGTDYYNEFRKGVTRPGTIGALTGGFFTANLYQRIINNDFLATFDHKITKDLALKFIAGTSVYENYYQRDQSNAQTLTVDQLYTFTNAASVVTTNTSSKKRIQGVYGDLGLSYKTFLYLDVTGRNDWSSTLPKANNSYFYPSVSGSFVFSELLPQFNGWLSYGKLRASYANVGGDTSPYGLDFVYSAASAVFAQYTAGATFPFNGLLGFTAPGTIPGLQTLKSQNQNSTEVGLELRFLKDRLTADVSYYNNTTKDQILSLPLPQSTGYAFQTINAGSVKNSGIEVTLGGIPVKSNPFTWNINVTYGKNTNLVTLPAAITAATVASGYSGLTIKAQSGTSIGLYGVAWQRDPNGNIIIDPATGLRKIVSDQRLGSVAPDYTAGIQNTFTFFKSFQLEFLLDIRKGGVLFSNTVSSLRTSGLVKETALNRGNIFIDKGVVQVGTTYVPNTVPVQSMQDYWSQYATGNTEANVFDASYIKLRELTFTYDIPSSFLVKHAKFFRGLSVGLEGRNLWIIHSNVPYIDPEVNFFGSGSAGEGVEFNSQPSTRTLGFNVTIKL